MMGARGNVGATANLDSPCARQPLGFVGRGEETGSWTYTLINADPDTDALAQSELASDVFSYTYVDGHGATSTTTLTIAIAGQNDAPEITSATIGGVEEDGRPWDQSTLTATDPDHGATRSWTAIGGTLTTGADYRFTIDNFSVERNLVAYFNDSFGDNNPPPSIPSVPESGVFYSVRPGNTFTEGDGRAIMDGAFGPGLGHSASLFTNFDNNNTTLGLKRDDDFIVEGRFDLVIPEIGQSYGVRLGDRVLPAGGPNHPGDDAIGLTVFRAADGSVQVRLAETDFIAATTQTITFASLSPAPGDDQIVLRLTHQAASPGVLTASFNLLSGGAVTHSETLAGIGQIFGTETPGDLSDDENWTQASFTTGSLPTTISTVNGIYGSLAVSQNGHWIYDLANGQANVQALAQGETVTDDFQVQVTDEHGAFDIETVSVAVAGQNDAPIVAGGTTLGAVQEEGPLTATGTLTATDVDHGAQLTWSIVGGGAGAYGTLGIDGSTGIWTYTLANGQANVQALAEGQAVTETFTAQVTDEHGAFDTEDITIEVAGSNDAPVIDARLTRVSVGLNEEANGPSGALGSGYPIIFGDNRHVAFYSEANNLVTDDTNGKGDFFIYDRASQITERIPAGINGPSDNAILTVSENGRFFAFNSLSPGLVSGDANGTSDIFIWAGSKLKCNTLRSGCWDGNELQSSVGA